MARARRNRRNSFAMTGSCVCLTAPAVTRSSNSAQMAVKLTTTLFMPRKATVFCAMTVTMLAKHPRKMITNVAWTTRKLKSSGVLRMFMPLICVPLVFVPLQLKVEYGRRLMTVDDAG